MPLKRPLTPMPADARRALQERSLLDAYNARPPYQRNDYLSWIERAKNPETRQKRLQQMLDELAGGTHYMNMAWRPGTAMIRAVIFDIGGPLDTEEQFEAAIDADIRSGLEREGFDVNEERWQAAHRHAIERCAPSVYRSVIWELSGGNYEASILVYDWMEARAAERDLFELREGIVDVLAVLKERGLKLGLAANQPLSILARLRQQGIGHYFDNKGVSGHYGFRKPDIRLFLRACEDLGVQPEECVMVGDRVDNDIVPAGLLGMRTVLFRTGRYRDQQPRSWDERPDADVSTIEDLLPAILSLLDEPAPVTTSPSPPAGRGTEGEG